MSNGKCILRPKGTKPQCKLCKKWDAELNQRWHGFTSRNLYYFSTFLAARAFKALPRPGGIDQQDPTLMGILVMLNELYSTSDRINDREFHMKLSGIMGGK